MSSAFLSDGEHWKCRKHSFHRSYGVCPRCLRDRLLLLCPDCASLHPCVCLPSSSSSSSLSSFSSFDPPRSSVGSAIGRIGCLIDGEPAFRRSRSAAFPFLLPTSGVACENGSAKRLGMSWSYSNPAAQKVEEALRSSRSVAETSRGIGGDRKGKGWKWLFPSPMKAFRHRRSGKILK